MTGTNPSGGIAKGAGGGGWTDGVGSGRWWRVGYPAVLAGAVLLAIGLLWMGSSAILSNTGGALVRTVDDPTQPGYETLVEPTRVLAAVIEGAVGGLDAVAVLSFTPDTESGSVLLVPPSTGAPADGEARPLAQIWSEDGLDATVEAVADTLNVGITESRLITSGQWEALVAPVAPLLVDNPTQLVASPEPEPPDSGNAFDPFGDALGSDEGVGWQSADGVVTFDEGVVGLPAALVGRYLGATVPGESELSRMVRHQRVWSAWLAGVGADRDNPGVVPGEVETGLGLYVRTLAAGEVELATLPVVAETDPVTGVSVLVPLVDEVRVLVARLIPFPVGARPDSRLRVRILDGTGELDNGLPAVATLVEAGAEVAAVGNARNFGYEVTQFILGSDADADSVSQLAATLGTGELVRTGESSSGVDVTVVLGGDAVGMLGGPYAPATEAPGG